MKTHVEFRSSKFPPYEGEEEGINPGRFGKRLAEFLAKGLAQQGFNICDPIAEDWGWVLSVENPGFSLWIGCGNYDEQGYQDRCISVLSSLNPVGKRLATTSVEGKCSGVR